MANITPISGIKAFLEAATLPASRTALGLGTGDSATFFSLALSSGGNSKLFFNAADFSGSGALAITRAQGIGFFSGDSFPGSTDATLWSPAANILYQRNGTAAQTFLLANTYTDDNNYERAVFGFASNVLRIGTENLGTGVARFLEFIVGGFRVGGIEDTGVFDITSISATGNINSAADVIAAGTVRSGVYTIANLPFPVAGARAFVSDQDDLNSVYGTPVSASDLNAVTAPVWSDGGGWFVG